MGKEEKKIRVFLADDHPLIRAGIRSSLMNESDIELVGEASNGDEVQQMCQQLEIDVLILDLSMPGPNARESVELLKQKHPQISILILTAFENEVYIRTLISMGVKGYVLKDEATETLVGAIRTIYLGGTCFSQRIVKKLVGAPENERTIQPPLNTRELEILKRLEKGFTTKEIAVQLSVTERTVRYHIENILQKLNVKNRLEAIACAVKNGWVGS